MATKKHMARKYIVQLTAKAFSIIKAARPNAYQVLKARHITSAVLVYGKTIPRFMLEFRELTATAADDFDRQVHTGNAAFVFDGHPDRVFGPGWRQRARDE